MKLISLQLCNFRQFYGKTPRIRFPSGEKNATVIHGNNGSGKTTILNAFTWVLYQKFTPGFIFPELLVNKRALAEAEMGASVECHVELVFEHEHKTYQLKRKCYGFRDRHEQSATTEPQLFMLVAGDDGKWLHPTENPQDIIERILPQSLHQYFFFDGEHIDHIFRSKDRHQIAEDTKELIGINVLQRGILHLKNAKKILLDELKIIGDINVKKLLKEQNQLESSLEQLRERQQLIIDRLEGQQQAKKEISSRLLEMSGAETLERLKQKLVAEERQIRNNLNQTNSQIKQEISTKGYTIFLDRSSHKFSEIIKQLRERGELPSGIKQNFVRQLLSRQQCICGTKLIRGEPPYQEVAAWMDRAGIAAVEEAAIKLEMEVKHLELQTSQLWGNVAQYQSNLNQWRTQLSAIESQIDEINEKLRKYPDLDIQKWQIKIEEIEENIRQLTLSQGEINLQVEETKKGIKELEKQINRQEIKEQKQLLVAKRIEATGDAIERIAEVKKRLENQFRLSLEKRVQEIFNSISFTPYIPSLNSNYELYLIENTSGKNISVAASTGENQILSLSFIGAIIDLVREWSPKNTLMGPDSSKLAVVMDSPFGSLDEIYRRQVAKSIPHLANQLVVLVTKTQWRREVETEMANQIGRHYVLVYRSSKADCQEDSLDLNGSTYPLVKKSDNNFEYTEVIEVPVA